MGDFEGLIYPFCKFLLRNLLIFFCLVGGKQVDLAVVQYEIQFRSIAWFQGQDSENHSYAGLFE